MSLDRLSPRLQRAGAWLSRAFAHAERRLSSLVLGGFAATAFGIAPLLPDPAALPRRMVVEAVAPHGHRRRSSRRWPTHDLDLCRSDLTRASDTADSLLRAPGRRRCRGRRLPAHATRSRGKLLDGRAGKMVQARADSNGTLIELVARYAAPTAHEPRAAVHAPDAVARSDGRWIAAPKMAPLVGAGAPGQRHDPHVAVRRHRRGAHPRRRGHADGRDLLPPTSTSTASCARATPSASSTRRSPPTASRSPGASAHRPRARRPSSSTTARRTTAHVVHRRRAAGRLLRPRRPEQAARVPRQPDGVLARHLGLRDALPPDPADTGARTTASTTARRTARRCARSATAWSSSPAGRTATATWSRSQHGNEREHAVRAPEPHRRAQGPARSTRASASARSAPPAGPPGRTCTSSSRSTASSRTR